MKNLKIVLTGFGAEKAKAAKQQAPGADYVVAESAAEVRGAIGKADALVGLQRAAFDEVLNEALIRSARRLRWLHASGAGVDAYCSPALVKSDIVFTNGKILQGPHVADQALALLLALTRGLHLVLRNDPRCTQPRPIELRGKRAVVVGAGGVGLLIAERLHAFGVTVECVNDANLPMLPCVSRTYMPDELREAVASADFVFCSAPLTPRSRGTFGEAEFAAMKKGAIFINVSRGGLVRTDALTAALQSQRLGAAGLDVTDPEPLPQDHPLRAMRNVVITPHMAGLSDLNHARSFDFIVRNLRRFIAGLPLVNVVDKKAGY